MVEGLLWEQESAGSNPVSRTKKEDEAVQWTHDLSWKQGLGDELGGGRVLLLPLFLVKSKKYWGASFFNF